MRNRLLLLCLGSALALMGCAGGGDGGDDDPRIDSGNGGPPDAPVGACPGGCTSPDKCCQVGANFFCISTSADPNNCGDCGNVCDMATSDTCAGSQCKCGFAPACTGTATCCDTGCKNLQSDPTNCGMCGRSCGLNSSCVAGECVCAATMTNCAAGESCCATGCVNTTTDHENCGGCGTACAASENCVGSQCACATSGTPCGAQEDCCSTGCINICIDVNNCGGCGNVCPMGASDFCFFGSCASMFPPMPLPECM